MKKRTISKLKSIFGSKKGKRQQQQQQSSKSSRSSSPEPAPATPTGNFRPIPRTPPPAQRVGPPPSPPVPTRPVAPVAPEPPGPQTLQPCSICGRTFLPQSLSKHEKICEKTTVKRRKTFDSSRQRREGLGPANGASANGTDLEQYLPKNFGLPENSPFLEKSPPNTAKVAPKPKPQSVRTTITKVKPASELQKCPHCMRAFGPRAFERHVEWCGDKAKILPAAPTQPPHVQDAKQRLNARTQYKAPPVRGRRSSQTREKSSNSRSASVESSRGVSPPRESGDYRAARTRASESLSSNDHDDSPHVPVIRNSRTSNCSGDANVKARQARLARDLSSSRISQEPKTPQEPQPPQEPQSVQPSTTDPIIKKKAPQNKSKLTVKKQQQLKKIEDLANKYKEKALKEVAEVSIKKTIEKSQIPVPRYKDLIKRKTGQQKVACENDTTPELKNDMDVSKQTKSKLRKVPQPQIQEKTVQHTPAKDKEKVKARTRKSSVKLVKENSMSLDSLEDVSNKKGDKNCQSIGINTELLCPSIPCIIYENPEAKKPNKNRKGKSNKVSVTNAPEPKVELLYKNLTVISSCDIEAKSESTSHCKVDNTAESNDYNTTLSTSEQFISDFTDSVCNISKLNLQTSNTDCHSVKSITDEKSEYLVNEESLVSEEKYCDESQYVSVENIEITYDPEVSTETIDDSLEHNVVEITYDREVSVETFDDSIEHNCEEITFNREVSAVTLDDSEEHNGENEFADDNFSRHGSGETYTKFTENAEDLEEFLTLTDKMMGDKNDNDTFELDKEIENICTPKTNSIEAINIQVSQENIISKTASPPEKRVFSDTFEELKNNLKELLKGAKSEPVATDSVTDNKEEPHKKVCDMEHITVYGMKFYDNKIERIHSEPKNIPEDDVSQNAEKFIPEKGVPQFRLPSISENNKPENKLKCNKKRMQRIYKPNRKVEMLGEQSRSNTFTKNEQEENSDSQSITSEAPPLKLPRIEIKRLDDNYDPFVSAARQMKELMSSDTNIPKKLQNSSKDPNRTLPILRPAKEKTPSSYLRTENTKMMKDTLNKTYQKTPTLQRMKSFGSTNIENTNNTIGSICSSFRLNRTDKKSSQTKLNTTFTKSSKENVGTMDKSYFNRNSSLNRSFSSYTGSNYSTPKPKDKIPKITTSMYHSFQRSTIKQPVKLDKINRDEEKKSFVNLDVILTDDNSSMTDSNYIDPRLINENDNLPINVNTILNNPDIISSMESLLTTENLPAKFESFNTNKINNNDSNDVIESKFKIKKIESNNNDIKSTAPTIDDLSAQYDKIMSSLEQSIASKTSIRDDDSLCEDFDLEEFMTSFDEEINKQKSEKRTCSSTTRVVKRSELVDSNRVSEMNSICSSPTVVKSSSNGMIPVNKSMSLNFSSNNIVNESLLPSSVKRSTSLLDSLQKKNPHKHDTAKSRKKTDQLEQDLMQSLKDFDKFYESERHESKSTKEMANYNTPSNNGTTKRDARVKTERIKKPENVSNGNYTPNGKVSNDSAYSSLNRISPSKLSLCNSKEPGPPEVASDSGSHKDVRSDSSDEFLAMERSAELIERDVHTGYKADSHPVVEKRANSRASSRRTHRSQSGLSSSGSESSLRPRLSRFCHECGQRFPLDCAKFCVHCGVKRLQV